MYKDNLDDSTFTRSVDFGEQIGKLILKRASVDDLSSNRGKTKIPGGGNPRQMAPNTT